MFNRHLQVKLVTDKDARKDRSGSDQPGRREEPVANDLFQQATACVVVGYTLCRSVDCFFRVAERLIVK